MTTPRPEGVDCPDWAPMDPTPGKPPGKRCRWYQDGGTCWQDDRFVCSEWAKKNAGVVPSGPRRLAVVPATTPAPAPVAPVVPIEPPLPSPTGTILTDEGDRGIHHCHAHACGRAVPPEMLMCRKHWSMVPPVLQQAVWASYRPGQTVDKDPSPSWMNAAELAIGEVAEREGHAAAAASARQQAKTWDERRLSTKLVAADRAVIERREAPPTGFARRIAPSPPLPDHGTDASSRLLAGLPPGAVPDPVDAPDSPDAGFTLAAPPPKAPKPPTAAEKARAAYEARLPGGRKVTITEPEPFTAAKEIPQGSLDALAAITDRIELDAGPLGKVALVRERTAEDDAPGAPIALTYEEAATLRLLVDSFPGARVVAIRRKGEGELE